MKVITADGHVIVGGDVKFTINGKTTTVKTNKKGIAQKTLNKKVIKKLKKR